MSLFRPSITAWLFLLFALVYSAQVLPRLGSDALTNDEPVEITNGHYYWVQGDIMTPHLHPPLASALSALPLQFLRLQTPPFNGDPLDRAEKFIFQSNRDKLSVITIASRSVSWLFGLFIGGLLFWITREEPVWCAATLFFWALDPTFLALAGLAKIELIPDFFFFWVLWLFTRDLQDHGRGRSWWAGLVAGSAIASKYDALMLVPLFIILEMLNRDKAVKPKVERWSFGALGVFAGLGLAYLPFFVLSPQRMDFFSIFHEKFLENIVFARHPFPVYFFGQAGLENHWYYLPIAFLLKEPVTFLFFLSLAGVGIGSKKLQVPPWCWLPVLGLGFALLPVTNLGVRYLLPIYPFLFLIAARGVEWSIRESKGRPLFKAALAVILLWQVFSLALNFPHDLSYFNELVLPDKKIHYLADSNLDWGQDAKRLAQTAQQRGWGKVKLAYWGGVDPAVYGLDWEPFQPGDLQKPQPGWVYVINAGFYQLAPVAYPTTMAIAESWIKSALPSGKVGDGWYFYEIPGIRREEKGPWLPSAPFQQYRGYAYALKRPS